MLWLNCLASTTCWSTVWLCAYRCCLYVCVFAYSHWTNTCSFSSAVTYAWYWFLCQVTSNLKDHFSLLQCRAYFHSCSHSNRLTVFLAPPDFILVNIPRCQHINLVNTTLLFLSNELELSFQTQLSIIFHWDISILLGYITSCSKKKRSVSKNWTILQFKHFFYCLFNRKNAPYSTRCS